MRLMWIAWRYITKLFYLSCNNYNSFIIIFINNWLFLVFLVLFKGVEYDVGFPIGGDNFDVNPNSEIGKDGTSNVPKQS